MESRMEETIPETREEESINHGLDALNRTQKLCNHYAIPRRSTASEPRSGGTKQRRRKGERERKRDDAAVAKERRVCLSSLVGSSASTCHDSPSAPPQNFNGLQRLKYRSSAEYIELFVSRAVRHAECTLEFARETSSPGQGGWGRKNVDASLWEISDSLKLWLVKFANSRRRGGFFPASLNYPRGTIFLFSETEICFSTSGSRSLLLVLVALITAINLLTCRSYIKNTLLEY